MTAEEQAKYLYSNLGQIGAWRQAAEEWSNSDTPEEREYWDKVMDLINAL